MKQHVSAYSEAIIRFAMLANHHLSPPPTNANSSRPAELKDDDPRLGYYIRTTHTHHTHAHAHTSHTHTYARVHTHTRPLPYLLRRLQSPHFSTLLHAVFSHIYFVRHDEISISATSIIISLLEPTLQTR